MSLFEQILTNPATNGTYNFSTDFFDNAVFHNSDLQSKLSVLGSKSFQNIMTVIALIIAIVILIYFKLSNKMTRYKSNMIKVTDDIYIPEPAGQGQYGTAHFLDKKELDKKYKYNILDENNEVVKMLLQPDEKENSEIKYYLDKGGISKEDSENLYKHKTYSSNEKKEEDLDIDRMRLVVDYDEDNYVEPNIESVEESDFNMLDVFEDDEDLDFCKNIIKIEEEKVKKEEAKKTPYNKKEDPYIIFERGGIIANIDILANGTNKIHYISSDLHTIDLGATRSGKTRCFILPTIGNQALAGHSICVSDPKGELYQYTNKFVKKLGYEVICLDFKNPDKSSRYNLLQPIIDAVNDNDIDRAINYTEELSNILVGECKGERIWHDGQKAVITGSILSTIIANKDEPEKQNLASVYRFINDSQGKSEADPNTCLLAKYIKFLQDKNPTHPAIDNFAPIINAAEQTRLSFISGAMNTLRLYSQPSIWKITHRTDINLTEMGERKQILYIILPDENTMYYPIASIIVSQLYNELVKMSDKYGGRLPIQVDLDLDEFGNFAAIPDLAAKLTVGAGRGIRLNLVLQDFAQMIKKYDKETTSIIKSNCQTWIYLKSTDPATLEELSKKLGKYTIASNSMSTSSSKEKGNINSQSTSTNLCGRELLQASELAQLKRPYALVMDGETPIMANTPDIGKTLFNRLYNMGNEKYNEVLRFVREKERPIIIEEDKPSYWRPFVEDADVVNYINGFTNNAYRQGSKNFYGKV